MWTLLFAAAGAEPGPWPDDLADLPPSVALPRGEAPSCRALDAAAFVQLPAYDDAFELLRPDRAWGTTWLADALAHAARHVQTQVPEADPVHIGDLSAARGGALPPHVLHQVGRDADVALWQLGGRQGDSFRAMTPSTLDLELTWLFIEGLIETGRVSLLLLDQRLIRAVKDYVVHNDLLAAGDLRWLFGSGNIPGVLRAAGRHADHLHVQVSCQP